jgi:hypothetical protein
MFARVFMLLCLLGYDYACDTNMSFVILFSLIIAGVLSYGKHLGRSYGQGRA